jgi:hypothetical protein
VNNNDSVFVGDIMRAARIHVMDMVTIDIVTFIVNHAAIRVIKGTTTIPSLWATLCELPESTLWTNL